MKAWDTRISLRKVVSPENSLGSREHDPVLSPNTSSSKIIPSFPIPNTWLGFQQPCWQYFGLKGSSQPRTCCNPHTAQISGVKKRPWERRKSHLYLSHANMEHGRTNTACPVLSPQALRLVFPECVSCCFQPGRHNCLGCMFQCEPHLQPHRAACSLPGSTPRPRISYLRNSWAWPKDLVT